MSNSSLKKTLTSYLTLENLIFVAVLGALGLYIFFQMVVLQTSNPQVAVTTTSMVPTYEGYDLTQLQASPPQFYDILRGDLLIVQNVEPHVGDVIVFNAPGQTTPIVHRIVAEKIENNTIYFATKGDHNGYSDAGDGRGNQFGWIPRSSVLGVVVFAIHHLGWASLQLQDPFIKGLLIVSILVLIVLSVFDFFSQNENEGEKTAETKQTKVKKRVYLKFSLVHFRINRPKVYFFLIVILLVTTYLGTGLVNYSTNTNSVKWVPSDTNGKNGIIDLRSNSANRPENYANLYLYNTIIEIHSSGTFNTVNKLVITPVFNNLSSSNPSYVWTIVYDYAGSKIIHAVFLFSIPQNVSNVAINTTLNFELFSTGLLGSAPLMTSQNVIVLI